MSSPYDPDTQRPAGDGPITCYRHPDREAPIGCSRCGRPICLDDAIAAPVGYLCPECAEQPKAVQRAHRGVARAAAMPATRLLLGAIAVIFLGQLANDTLWVRGALFGPRIAGGEWYRIVTSAFLHSNNNLLHVVFNGYLLWMLGQMLERGIGTARFVALYAAGLLGGSAGALLLTWDSRTIGASGAVFGLMGAAMVGLRQRGINPWSTGIGTLVLLNLAFTVLAPNVSLGGHMGGLAGGALAAVPIFHLGRRRDNRELMAAWAIAGAIGVLALVAGVAGPLT